MIDRDRVERATALFRPPDDAFERMLRRRDRKQRNRRIGAAVLAFTIAGAGFVALVRTNLGRSETGGSVVAHADETRLGGGQFLDLDTGAVLTRPGKEAARDIYLEIYGGTTEAPTVNLTTRGTDNGGTTNLGAVDFDGVGITTLIGLGYTDRGVTDDPEIARLEGSGRLLAPGDVIAVRTSEGNYAKVQILRYPTDGTAAGSIVLRFLTYAEAGER